MKNPRLLVPVAVLGLSLTGASSVVAAGPERDPVTVDSYDFQFSCGDDFDVRISGTSSTKSLFWLDEQGTVTRFRMQVAAPRDVLTNLDTMTSVEVGAHFVQTYTRVPGTNEYTVTVVGHRYLATDPGAGIIMRDVGRIVFSDPSEQTVTFEAGVHDAADPDLLGLALCGLVD